MQTKIFKNLTTFASLCLIVITAGCHKTSNTPQDSFPAKNFLNLTDSNYQYSYSDTELFGEMGSSGPYVAAGGFLEIEFPINLAGRPSIYLEFYEAAMQRSGKFRINLCSYEINGEVYNLDMTASSDDRLINITTSDVYGSKWKGNFVVAVVDTATMQKKVLYGTFAMVH